MKNKLLNPKENKKYYSKSDGMFMTLEQALGCHKILDRCEWARRWTYEVSSRTHIDVGCKDGYLCLTLQQDGIDCIGIDPSEDAIEEAKTKAIEARLDCKFMVGMAEEIPDGIRADTVTCMEVLEHVVDPDIVMKKLCKMGRYLLVSTPVADGQHGKEDVKDNEEHIRIYTELEFKRFCGDYGKIIECIIRDDQICIILRT